MVFLLVRHLSPYTQNDMYLGIFSEYPLKYKREYINYIEANGDPYKNQAYFEVDLEKDIEITEMNVKAEGDVYVVVSVTSAMGQVIVEVIRITSDFEECKNTIKKHHEENDDDSYIEHCMYFTMTIDTLYYTPYELKD